MFIYALHIIYAYLYSLSRKIVQQCAKFFVHTLGHTRAHHRSADTAQSGVQNNKGVHGGARGPGPALPVFYQEFRERSVTERATSETRAQRMENLEGSGRYFCGLARRGRFQYGDRHFGQETGGSGLRGYQLPLQRRQVKSVMAGGGFVGFIVSPFCEGTHASTYMICTTEYPCQVENISRSTPVCGRSPLMEKRSRVSIRLSEGAP